MACWSCRRPSSAGRRGCVLAQGLIRARPWPRREEMARAGKEAFLLVSGAVPLLVVAGLLEAGVARRLGRVLLQHGETDGGLRFRRAVPRLHPAARLGKESLLPEGRARDPARGPHHREGAVQLPRGRTRLAHPGLADRLLRLRPADGRRRPVLLGAGPSPLGHGDGPGRPVGFRGPVGLFPPVRVALERADLGQAGATASASSSARGPP